MSCRILFLSVVIQLMLSGCFSSRVKEPQDKITTLRRNESRSVKAESIRGVRARLLRKTGRTANFSLVCDGRFFVKSARERIVERAGRCEKAFGFFPGFYSMSESADGNNYAKGVAMCGWIVLENAATAFVPTFFSLFYGPFSEYFNGGETMLGSITSQGLVGCYKWRRFYPWREEFSERESGEENVDTYVLSGYTISSGGKTYACEADEKSIPIPVRANEGSIEVEIVSVPELGGDLGRSIDSLVGCKLVVFVENEK